MATIRAIRGLTIATLAASLGSLGACSSSDDSANAPNGAVDTSAAAGSSSSGGAWSTGGNSNAGNSNAGNSNAGNSNAGNSNAGNSNGGGSQSVAGFAGTSGSGGVTAGASSGGAGSGNAGSGGSAGSDTGVAACPGASATEFNWVSGWLNNSQTKGALPQYAYDNIKKTFPAGEAFNQLACSIAMACVEFAPMEANWLRQCEAVVTSAIVAESSYDPKEVVNDSYSTRAVGSVTANDPTIGLLQIRFSSTVHDYNYFGSLPKMAAIGCAWPAELSSQADTAAWWATNGGSSYIPFMEQVPCNIGLAAWYYFYNATGNGGQTALYISDYCSGHGIAGNMVDGLLSHLMGGAYPRPADANNAYPWGIECCAGGSPNDTMCTGCTGRFAAFMGVGSSNARPTPDPFQQSLAPEVSKYCR